MVRIAWRMLAQRPAAVLATFVALWFAVAMVTACGGMLESGLRYHGTVSRYAAAPVLVAATDVRATEGSGEDRDVESHPLQTRGPLPRSLPAKVAAAAGVRAAVTDVAVPARVLADGGTATVEVHPWSSATLAPFTLRAGTAPRTSHDVVLDNRLATRLGAAVGQRLQVVLPSGPRTVRISGIAASHGTPGASTVFADDATTRALSGGTVQVIGVLPRPGVATSTLASAVRAALPPAPDRPSGSYPHVFTGGARGEVESTDVGQARQFVIPVSSVFGGATLLIAVLVIVGTVGLSVRQRRRDIALLRAVAATPRQVRRMVLRETAALGVLAGVSGVWPGLAGAHWLRDEFVKRAMVPGTFTARVSWLPPLVAAAAALVVAVAAAWVATLRPSRIRPTEALAETAVERTGLGAVRTVLGLVALAGGTTLCIVSASTSGNNAAGVAVGTVFTLVVAVALLSPLLIRATAATLGYLLRILGVTGRLAAANTATSARALSPVLSSLVLAVALGGSLWFVQTSEQHVADRQAGAGLRADWVVKPPAPGMPSAEATAIRETPGVLAATGVTRSTMFASDSGVNDYSAQGVDAAGLARTMDLGVVHGSTADLVGNSVAVDTLTADALDLRVGEQFHGWFGDGVPARLRVVAIYTRGLGFAQLTVPRGLLRHHAPTGFDDLVLVTVAPHRPAVVAALRRELGRTAPGAALLPAHAYRVGLDRDLAQNAWTNQVVTAVLLLYVGIAAVNTLAMAALARRREFGVLRLSGTTRGQLLQMARLERVLLLGLALVVGGVIAAGTLVPMVKGITGSATPYIPLAGWVTVIGGVVLLGTLASAVPLRRVLRTRPVEAIGLRE